METLGTRLKELRKNKKLTQQNVADVLGVSKTSVIYWEKDENVPKHESLTALAKLLDTSADWLLTGKESKDFKPLSFDEIKRKFGEPTANLNDMISDIGVYEYGDPVPEGFTAIDYYPDIKASAGNGYINLEESSPFKIFIPTVEVITSGASATHCKIINVDGESMIPDLYPDQKISLDMSAKKIYDGEIYGFTKGDELKIKILFNWGEEGQGGFKAVSRNPDKIRFPDEYYSPAQIESENIQIIGQYWMKIDIRKVRR